VRKTTKKAGGRSKPPGQLNERQRRFVEEFDGNATQSAIRAGYAKKSAASQAWVLLRNPKVTAALSAHLAKRRERAAMDANEVVRCLAVLATGNIIEYGGWGATGGVSRVASDRLTPEQRYRIRSIIERRLPGGIIELKFELESKKAALDSLMRYYGLFQDKVELTVRHSDALLEATAAVIEKYVAPDRAPAAVIELVQVAQNIYARAGRSVPLALGGGEGAAA